MHYFAETNGFYLDNPPKGSVPLTPEEHRTLLAGQSNGKCIVADGSGFPVLQDRPKATVSEVWERIKAERDRRKAGGVQVGDKWFHTDDGSRIQQIGLAMMGSNLPAGLQWKTLDGSFVTMTPQLAQSVFTAVAASDQAIFGAAEKHRVAMTATADPSAYDYSGGWPKIYGE